MSKERRSLDVIAREFIEQTEIANRAKATTIAAQAELAKANMAICLLEEDLTSCHSNNQRDTVIVYEHATILIPVFGKPKLIDRICVRL